YCLRRRIQLQRIVDASPYVGGGRRFRDFLGQRLQSALPQGHRRRGLAAGAHLVSHLGARVGIEHAQHVFGIAQVVVAFVGGRVHESRHVRSCMRLRRIQLFMVPSGTWQRVANSLYVAPLKKASRTELRCCGSSASRQSVSRRCSWLVWAWAAGEGCSSTASSSVRGSSGSSSRRWRRRSIALLRDSVVSQVIALALAASKLAARFHTVM